MGLGWQVIPTLPFICISSSYCTGVRLHGYEHRLARLLGLGPQPARPSVLPLGTLLMAGMCPWYTQMLCSGLRPLLPGLGWMLLGTLGIFSGGVPLRHGA
jgi:hypothetical protein